VAELLAEGTTPLGRLHAGQTGVVDGIQGGRGIVRRLAAHGILPGTSLNVIANTLTGPIIVEVRGSRLALGRGEAMKIMVRSVPAGGKGPKG
jgi:ferrous iron transport protein A